MKVMISQPMAGKSNEQIRKEREEIVQKFKSLHIDILNTLIEESAEPKSYNEYHPALFYMGESIKYMGQVDAIYFMKGWEQSRGCRIERAVAQEYNVKILDHDFLDSTMSYTAKIMQDFGDNLRNNLNISGGSSTVTRC